jgi:hypothetical protein
MAEMYQGLANKNFGSTIFFFFKLTFEKVEISVFRLRLGRMEEKVFLA